MPTQLLIDLAIEAALKAYQAIQESKDLSDEQKRAKRAELGTRLDAAIARVEGVEVLDV